MFQIQVGCESGILVLVGITREGFLRKNIVAVLFFQNYAVHPYS